MGTYGGPQIVKDGLVFAIDPANSKSYAGTGTALKDLAGRGHHPTFNTAPTHSNRKFGISQNTGAWEYVGAIAPSSTCTVQLWMETDDIKALFLKGNNNASYYFGAFRAANKEYYAGCGSPDFFVNAVEVSNIYDNIRGNVWRMLEWKNVDFSIWTRFGFSYYTNYKFNSTTTIGEWRIYDRNLTAAESLQNYNATKNRYI